MSDDHDNAADDRAMLNRYAPDTYGSSEVYPSKAAGYGVEGLMAMAGTLAEQAEDQLGDMAPDMESAARAQIGTIYGLLALTQAVRDLPEQIAATLRALDEADPAASILPEALMPHVGMAAHDGYAEHSHEVRPDHRGVAREADHG